MSHELVVRGGTTVDGSESAPVSADIGIDSGIIAPSPDEPRPGQILNNRPSVERVPVSRRTVPQALLNNTEARRHA